MDNKTVRLLLTRSDVELLQQALNDALDARDNDNNAIGFNNPIHDGEKTPTQLELVFFLAGDDSVAGFNTAIRLALSEAAVLDGHFTIMRTPTEDRRW